MPRSVRNVWPWLVGRSAQGLLGSSVSGCAIALLVVIASQPLFASSTEAETFRPEERTTLEQLVAQVVRVYPGIQARLDAVEAARAGVMSAQWGYFPSPSITAESNQGDADLVAEVSQPIWSGGRIEANVALNRAELEVSRWALREARQDVALRVIEEYEAFASASMVLVAYNQYISDLDEFNEMMRRRVRRGYSAEVDASLVASRLSQAIDVQTNLDAARLRALASLSELVGHPIEPLMLELPRDTGRSYDLRLDDAEFVSQAELVNPRLNRLAAEVGVAKAQIQQTRSSLWPTVSVKAQHREFGNGAPSDGRIFVSMDFSWGNGLSVVENIRSAEFQKGVAIGDQAAFRADLRSAVRADLHTLRASETLVQSLTANQRTQREIYDSYVRMFLVGQRTWLDVLNIMREAVEAERSLASAQASYASTLLRLRILVGDVTWTN